jgi:hypothetical protein
MNDLALNALAEGILTYVKSQISDPREGIAVLGLALCLLYDNAVDPNAISFAKFAKDFHDSLIATHKDATNTGPRLVQ